jgi:carbon monoxide dehydrogenase subunit G
VLLKHEVTVPGSADRVFALFNDVERIASCMPGATLDGQDGDAYLGQVTLKIGPITAAYAGTVRFLEVEPAAHRLRLQARGAEKHGSGDAEAAIDLTVSDTPAGALVQLTTDLIIRGKIAQFGKGAIVAVSGRILDQFAQNLAGLLAQPDAAEPAGLFVRPDAAERAGLFVQPEAEERAGLFVRPDAAERAGLFVQPEAEERAGLFVQPDAAERAGPEGVSARSAASARPAAQAAVPAAARAVAARAPASPAATELDALSLILGPTLTRYAPVAAAFAVGLFEGWLVARAFGRRCAPTSRSAR